MIMLKLHPVADVITDDLSFGEGSSHTSLLLDVFRCCIKRVDQRTGAPVLLEHVEHAPQ